MAELTIPTALSQIDSAWLSRALGVEVVATTPVEPLRGIAMTSQLVRLRLELASSDAGPSSIVVKLWSPRWEHGPELHEREVRFYRDFAAGRDLPVPRCYHADFDPSTGAFVLVLEDLSAVDPGHCLDGMSRDQALALLDAVAELHATWWQHSDVRPLKIRGHHAVRIERTVASFDDNWRALAASDRFLP